MATDVQLPVSKPSERRVLRFRERFDLEPLHSQRQQPLAITAEDVGRLSDPVVAHDLQVDLVGSLGRLPSV